VLTYFALGDTDAGRANIQDFYRLAPKNIATNAVLRTTRETIGQSITQYTDLGVDEIIFIPATDDLDEVTRLADIVT
jgi:MinD-like ATPase involved in chromosome partitioning or flagellar assembly